jgi:hypothetical protein
MYDVLFFAAISVESYIISIPPTAGREMMYYAKQKSELFSEFALLLTVL